MVNQGEKANRIFPFTDSLTWGISFPLSPLFSKKWGQMETPSRGCWEG